MKRLIILLAILPFGVVYSQDRLFTYTYQSTVLNKGQKELEVWNTFRTGRNDYYLRLDHRTEYEVGLGSRLQTAFYLNLTTTTRAVTRDSVLALATGTGIGFSNEWKYKLLDPVADPFGLALYGEYGISSDEIELEGKLILDKVLGKVTLAANGIYELELEPALEKGKLEWEKEQEAGLNVAVAYSFSPRFSLTSEHTLKNVISGGKLEHSALYSGIGLSWTAGNFWVNLTALPQVTSFKGHGSDRLNLTEFEKYQFRLLFSYVF